MHSPKLWTPSDYISLRDEVDQRGREDFGSEWPEPPAEEDYEREVSSRQKAGAALEAKASSHAIVEADPKKWAAPFKLSSLFEASGFPMVAHMRRKSIIDDLKFGYEKNLRTLSADIVGNLRTELYEGRREAFRKTSSGHLEPVNKEYWASDSAGRLLSDWRKSGGDVFFKEAAPKPIRSDVVDARETDRPIEKIKEFMRRVVSEADALERPNNWWKNEIKKDGLHKSDRIFDAAWLSAVEEKIIIPLKGSPKREKRQKLQG